MTSDRSRIHDSRLSDDPGLGFPSCATALCRVPPNRRDPHGYYAELGVPPWATPAEIRAAARSLYRRFHPDTGADPDPGRLQRVKLITEVLLDPGKRALYDQTPPGKRLLDPVYRSELVASGITGNHAADLVADLVVGGTAAARRVGYDYLSVGRRRGDRELARDWYECLLRAAPAAGYDRRIKVMLTCGGPPSFDATSSVMAVPRSWRPSTSAAFGLLTVTAGVSRAHRAGALG